MALVGAENNKKVVLIKNSDPLLNQDYTNGKTGDILKKLEAAGAQYLDNYSDFFTFLENNFEGR